jgi:hypothetical protein
LQYEVENKKEPEMGRRKKNELKEEDSFFTSFGLHRSTEFRYDVPLHGRRSEALF